MMLILEQIPGALVQRPQWLVWRLESRGGKPTKVPYQAKNGQNGKSNDPSTWSSFDIAARAVRSSDRYSGVGFAFSEGDGLCGVDLDKCINEDGEIEPWAQEVIDRFSGSYVELSPSGKGIRVFCFGSPHRCGKGTVEKRIELYDYTSPRYLTVTGQRWSTASPEVTEQQAALDWLHSRFFAQPKTEPPASRSSAPPTQNDEIDRITDALSHIPPEDREEWLQVGMALHAFDSGGTGYGLWENWSRLSDKFNEKDQRRTWKSFRRDSGGVKLGTLFKLAQDYGWQPKRAPRREGPPPTTDEPARASSSESRAERTRPAVWTDSFQRNDKGGIRATLGNVRLILENDERWEKVLGYCEFSYRLMKIKPPPFPHGQVGEWSDVDTTRLRVWISDEYGFTPASADAQDVALMVAQTNVFHPVRRYLAGVTWDKEPRLAHWMGDWLGSRANETYLAEVGTKFLIGAVARVMKPGCKMDNVLILEGVQGLKKSSSIEALFGEWFSDAPILLGDKDAYQNIHGCWCVELAEMDAFNKAESTTAKSFFSQRRDRYRPSYGRFAQDFPRQCVFMGSTNQHEYFKDYSGNTRYWPVSCEHIEIEAIRDNRDQLWAEAYHRYREGEPWWIDRANAPLFEAEQDARMQADAWESVIDDWLSSQTREHVTAHDVLTEAIKMPTHMIQKSHQMRIAPIMQKLGWGQGRAYVPAGEGKNKQTRVYVRPKKAPDG